MLKIIRPTVCAVFLAAAMQVAFVQDAFTQELPREFLNRLMAECRGDYHHVCSDVLPGEGRVGRCLEDHEEQLSPNCLKAVKFAYAIRVCHSDAQRYCSGVPIGEGRMFSCLAGNMHALSPSCEHVVRANVPYAFPRGEADRGNGYSPRDSYEGRDGYDRPREYGAPPHDRSYTEHERDDESYSESSDEERGYSEHSYYFNDHPQPEPDSRHEEEPPLLK